MNIIHIAPDLAQHSDSGSSSIELYMRIAYMGLNMSLCTVHVTVWVVQLVHFLAFILQYVLEMFNAHNIK